MRIELQGQVSITTMPEKIEFDEEQYVGAVRSAVGNFIRNARLDLDMSQAKLAELMNTRQAYISDLETGKTEPTVSTLILLSYYLRKPVEYLIPDSIFHVKRKPMELEELSADEQALITKLRTMYDIPNYNLAVHLMDALVTYWDREHRYMDGE